MYQCYFFIRTKDNKDTLHSIVVVSRGRIACVHPYFVLVLVHCCLLYSFIKKRKDEDVTTFVLTRIFGKVTKVTYGV